jgi:hypothetical protein
MHGHAAVQKQRGVSAAEMVECNALKFELLGASGELLAEISRITRPGEREVLARCGKGGKRRVAWLF